MVLTSVCVMASVINMHVHHMDETNVIAGFWKIVIVGQSGDACQFLCVENSMAYATLAMRMYGQYFGIRGISQAVRNMNLAIEH